ncbi:TetR/AcrR family transcriptional regulator [Pseudonocardia sp. TRM90224]|uniref:TetR/AcrR family transcriptional regulator n=1 Tax=Pseudonocardia sp. TRM90224 TaxID=2812678 RepID=UPI001E5852EA|nr:TetR/AcrR family transcriptional regulator [Pseudonocardia sp. TRM90224]
MDRRAALTEGALAYVLEHGLIGLSLRPLAAALGTSDRMLIYHFANKETLIAEVVALANRRLAESIDEADPPVRTVGDLVRYAWRVVNDPVAHGAMRLYLQMCVLSVHESDGWRSAHEQSREPWLIMLRTGLAELAIPQPRVEPLADLILDTVDGLLLDSLVTSRPARVDAAAAAFADLLDHDSADRAATHL